MSKSNNDAVSVPTDSPFPVVASADARAMLATQVAEAGIGVFDLDRIKLPTGGGNFFELPGLDGPTPAQEFHAVITAVRANQKAWHRTTMDEGGGGSFPDCRSYDGETGWGNRDLEPEANELGEAVQGQHSCADCPWNQFGSARGEGSGKDCSDSTHLVFYREGVALPDLMIVPAGSLKAVRNYLLSLAKHGVHPQRVVTSFKLDPAVSRSGQKYSRLNLTVARTLTDAEADAFADLKAPSDQLLLAAATL